MLMYLQQLLLLLYKNKLMSMNGFIFGQETKS